MDTSNSSTRANPRPIDIKVRNAVENHYSENPIESTLVEKLTSSFEETGQAVQCQPVEDYPLGVVTQIEPVQSGSGDPSPDNIRPITGHTSVTLTRCGKNLFGYETLGAIKSLNNDVALTEIENGVRATATRRAPGVISTIGRWLPISVLDGKTVTISVTMTRSVGELVPMLAVGYVNTDISIRKIITQTVATGDVTKATVNFNVSTTDAEGRTHIGLWFYINLSNTTTQVGDYVDFTDFQIEIGDTATKYEPYKSNTFTMELGQTVYGGSLNWKTGILTVEYGIQDLSELAWFGPVVAYSNRIYYTDPFPAAASLIAGGRKGWCSVFNCLNGITLGSLPNNSLAYSIEEFSGAVRIYIRADDVADMAALMAVLEGQTMVYQLAEPITVQLTPTEVQALSGTNTLTSDCGNTTVTGKVDPTAAVEKLTNAIIALGGTV